MHKKAAVAAVFQPETVALALCVDIWCYSAASSFFTSPLETPEILFHLLQSLK